MFQAYSLKKKKYLHLLFKNCHLNDNYISANSTSTNNKINLEKSKKEKFIKANF